MKLKCNTCNEMKHDTAFLFKEYKWYRFWENSFELDTEKCLDCYYPHRWDGIRETFNEIIKNNNDSNRKNKD